MNVTIDSRGGNKIGNNITPEQKEKAEFMKHSTKELFSMLYDMIKENMCNCDHTEILSRLDALEIATGIKPADNNEDPNQGENDDPIEDEESNTHNIIEFEYDNYSCISDGIGHETASDEIIIYNASGHIGEEERTGINNDWYYNYEISGNDHCEIKLIEKIEGTTARFNPLSRFDPGTYTDQVTLTVNGLSATTTVTVKIIDPVINPGL